MVQLLNLVVQNLGAPALHNSGFAVSSIHPLYNGIKFPCRLWIYFFLFPLSCTSASTSTMHQLFQGFGSTVVILWYQSVLWSTWKYIIYNLRKFSHAVNMYNEKWLVFRFIKLFWLITCFGLSQFWEDIFIQKSSSEILFLFLMVSFLAENSEKTYQASLLTKLFIWYLWTILTSSCRIFEFVFISGFLLSDMAKRFLLGCTPFFSEVLGWRYYLTVEELDSYWLTKFILLQQWISPLHTTSKLLLY